jgi:DNA-directed RNA polymerase subunit N (RpoN/RPB10)
MFPYIVCFCGKTIGHLYAAYIAIRGAMIKAARGDVAPEMYHLALSDVETGEILDQLGLRLSCCRTRMMSQVTYKELY